MKKEYPRAIFTSGMIAVCAVLFFEILLVTPAKQVLCDHFGESNLPAMFLSVLFYSLLWMLLKKCRWVSHPATAVILTAAFGTVVLLSYWYEPWAQDAEGQIGILLVPRRWYMLLVFTGCCFLFAFLTGYQKLHIQRIVTMNDSLLGRVLVTSIAIILILLSMYHAYLPNCFARKYAWHHLHAYLNSILNLYWGQAYTETVTSIYGHYAFFYLPLLKLAHRCWGMAPMRTYMIVNSLLTAGILGIWFVVLCKNVHSKVLQVLGMVTISYLNTAQLTSIYPQMFPHRILPQAVMVLLFSIWYKSKRKRTLVSFSGYLACVLILVWSVEFGLFASLAWSAMLCCSQLQVGGKQVWPRILLCIAAVPFVFLVSVLLCGALNILVGGNMISIREFIFPLLNQGYMQGILTLPLLYIPSVWMPVMLGLFLLLGLGLSNTVLGTGKNQIDDQTAVCFALAVLGLGAVSYAINRPTYVNFYIILPLMGLLIPVLAEQLSEQRRKLVTCGWGNGQKADELFCAGLGTICMLVLCVLFITAMINIPHKITQQRDYHNSEEFSRFIEDINATIDEKAVAAGGGASNVYAMLDRDPEIYCMDFSDIFITNDAIEEGEKLLGELEGKPALFSQDVIEFGIPESFLETHRLASEFRFMDIKFYYYTPIS